MYGLFVIFFFIYLCFFIAIFSVVFGFFLTRIQVPLMNGVNSLFRLSARYRVVKFDFIPVRDKDDVFNQDDNYHSDSEDSSQNVKDAQSLEGCLVDNETEEESEDNNNEIEKIKITMDETLD